ncbi:MAG: hypothetical protein FRX49_12359 [Trebouxia sp. A1-2]|nr:MAG: hypothetical protein FRX49_12359 [Trebouxia sp. A1-2]
MQRQDQPEKDDGAEGTQGGDVEADLAGISESGASPYPGVVQQQVLGNDGIHNPDQRQRQGVATLCRPKPREASRPRKQTQGIHKSPRPFFISMLVPFTVVLNVMDFPKEEPTARQQPCMIVHTPFSVTWSRAAETKGRAAETKGRAAETKGRAAESKGRAAETKGRAASCQAHSLLQEVGSSARDEAESIITMLSVLPKVNVAMIEDVSTDIDIVEALGGQNHANIIPSIEERDHLGEEIDIGNLQK